MVLPVRRDKEYPPEVLSRLAYLRLRGVVEHHHGRQIALTLLDLQVLRPDRGVGLFLLPRLGFSVVEISGLTSVEHFTPDLGMAVRAYTEVVATLYERPMVGQELTEIA